MTTSRMTKTMARALLHRLIWAAAARAPYPEEEVAITNELGTSLEHVPSVFIESLEALLAQKETELPIEDADAGWSWTLQVVAQLVPGAEVVWDGDSMRLTLPNLALSLFVEAGAPASGRGARILVKRQAVDVKRQTVDAEGRHVVHLTSALESLVAACEIHCVAGCCGLVAFEIAEKWMRNWLTKDGIDAGHAAARDLAEILVELEAAPRSLVVSHRFNAIWPDPAACAQYLRRWQECLEAALGPSSA